VASGSYSDRVLLPVSHFNLRDANAQWRKTVPSDAWTVIFQSWYACGRGSKTA
jgi:hypothetical protein